MPGPSNAARGGGGHGPAGTGGQPAGDPIRRREPHPWREPDPWPDPYFEPDAREQPEADFPARAEPDANPSTQPRT